MTEVKEKVEVSIHHRLIFGRMVYVSLQKIGTHVLGRDILVWESQGGSSLKTKKNQIVSNKTGKRA